MSFFPLFQGVRVNTSNNLMISTFYLMGNVADFVVFLLVEKCFFPLCLLTPLSKFAIL